MSATPKGQGSEPGSRWSVHFDPRTGADRSVAYSRVTHPVSPSGITPTRPKTLQASRTTMQAWEQEVAEFEIKYAKRVDEDAKILALKSIMPETLFGESRCVPREIIQYLRRTSHIHYQVFGRQSTSVNDDEIEFVECDNKFCAKLD